MIEKAPTNRDGAPRMTVKIRHGGINEGKPPKKADKRPQRVKETPDKAKEAQSDVD